MKNNFSQFKQWLMMLLLFISIVSLQVQINDLKETETMMRKAIGLLLYSQDWSEMRSGGAIIR